MSEGADTSILLLTIMSPCISVLLAMASPSPIDLIHSRNTLDHVTLMAPDLVGGGSQCLGETHSTQHVNSTCGGAESVPDTHSLLENLP